MSNVTLYVAIFTMFAMTLATITAWSRRDVLMRSVVVVLWVGLIPSGWFTLNDLLSRPKVATFEKLKAPGRCAAILHADIRERVGVYVLLRDIRLKNQEPRFMHIEWDLKFAQRLQRALKMQKVAKVSGLVVLGDRACQEMKRRGGGTQDGKKRGPLASTSGDVDGDEGDVMFYPDPVSAPPPKDLTPFYVEPTIQMPNR